MTIKQRLMILVAFPLMFMIAIGVLTRQQLARIDNTTRFAAESRVEALARLGDITRCYLKMRISWGNSTLST